MPRKVLKNKPLIEAIFELRWALQEPAPGFRIDPHYKLLIGRLYDKLSENYPYYEQLPTAAMPDEIGSYIVQHRFRKAKDIWPLVQLGPGIITVNDTDGYIWEDFEIRIDKAVKMLFEVYDESGKPLSINRLLLRYIDGIRFDFGDDDIFDFLQNQLKTNISLYPKLFETEEIQRLPSALDLRFSFPSENPNGRIHLRFVQGKKNGIDALIWETMVESLMEDASEYQKNILEWINKAHDVTDDWFFKLIEGELEGRFE